MSETTFEESELRPYPKIPARGCSGVSAGREWIAAEKVYGAHFAVVCEGDSIRAAKRRDLLGDEELDAFFGVSRIWPRLSVAAGPRCGGPGKSSTDAENLRRTFSPDVEAPVRRFD
ncbi:hypothetical protein ABZW30_16290 [Kitasatospora sp. NPDC004669]|uniref:hypothetical protein n=1 Tax=Kitasatospora sp. NPDC004669 TaxID=3154555 RepID=UPI0033B74DE9